MKRIWASTCKGSRCAFGIETGRYFPACGCNCGYLERYELEDGEHLFRVQATYARSIPPVSYYVVAATAKDAASWFCKVYTWLSLVVSCDELTGEDAETVLGDAQHYCVQAVGVSEAVPWERIRGA